MIPQPWECPKCGTIIAPWVAEHRCQGDTGGAAVGARVPPDHPSGGIGKGLLSIDDARGTGWTFEFRGTVASGADIARSVERELLKYAQRNPRSVTVLRGAA